MDYLFQMNKGKLMSMKEAAEYLGISSQYLGRISNEGKIPFLGISDVKVFDRADLDAFQKERLKEPAKLRNKGRPPWSATKEKVLKPSSHLRRTRR